ncbi:F-box protein like [Actinidia chinensis var. chinensis]|uniref:F-box protein like n=1 Tax=Actinidia chinensis var. chinensis TaxID=1590841 RepID=A0A2R6RD67_ACTCC|nr:F-box protein like [Actinidia chinensis var. chinensis]
MNFDLLPEDCMAHILSFSSPRDACQLSLLSSAVKAAAEYDVVWEKFLPSDYQDILSRLASPLVFKSKKELFLRLSNPILVDKGKKMLWLDKSTSKKCYMLSARELSITWANDPLYWCWKPFHQSRFDQVVELVTTWWLEINGTIHTRMLSPNTTYKAYLIVKFADRAYGLDSLPSDLSVEVRNHKSNGTIYLRYPEDKKQLLERLWMLNRIETLRPSGVATGEERVPCERDDGWMEIELGEFFCGESNEEVKMSLKEVKSVHLKGGLIVEGIELRPKK